MLNLNQTIKFPHDEDMVYGIRVVRGDIVECMTPEGKSDDFVCFILIENMFTGTTYCLKTPIFGKIISYYDEQFGDFASYINAHTMATSLMERIKAKGFVNLEHWQTVDPKDY